MKLPDIFTPEERARIIANRNRPPQERFAALVKKGIIDEQGNVLVRMPYLESDYPPEPDKKPG
jgi:hypothetical protein